MSVNAVMAVLQTKLSGWHTPGMDSLTPPVQPWQAFIAPPQVVLETMEGPICFIWGAKAAVHRTTAPHSPGHTGGFKRAPWKVDCFLFFIDQQPNDATDWHVILDSFRWAVEDILYPQTITDPNSQPQNTQLIEIAENIEIDAADPEPIDDQSNLLYTAHLVVTMTEDYQS